MNDNLLSVKALHKEVTEALKAIALKHGLTVGSNKVRYDDYTRKLAVVFNVAAKAAEKAQVEAEPYVQGGDPKIGQVVGYRRTTYKVTGYNRAGNLKANRIVDDAAFTFKRNRINGKFDYFDGMVKEVVPVPTIPTLFGIPVTKVGIRDQKAIMNEIVDTYGALSPENLTCDGELPRSQVNARYSKLNKTLRSLFQELGKEVSEEDAWAWWEKNGRGK